MAVDMMSSVEVVLCTFDLIVGSLALAVGLVLFWQLVSVSPHSARDGFVIGLCITCTVLSAIGLLNALLQLAELPRSPWQSQAQAWLQLSCIVMQLVLSALDSHRTAYMILRYLRVGVLQDWLSFRQSCVLVALAWTASLLIALTIGGLERDGGWSWSASANVVTAAWGFYCYYDVSSPVVLYWFAPVLVIVVVIHGICCGRLMAIRPAPMIPAVVSPAPLAAPSRLARAVPVLRSRVSSELAKHLARRSVLWLALSSLCWLPVLFSALYALTHSRRLSVVMELSMHELALLCSLAIPIVHICVDAKLAPLRAIILSGCKTHVAPRRYAGLVPCLSFSRAQRGTSVYTYQLSGFDRRFLPNMLYIFSSHAAQNLVGVKF